MIAEATAAFRSRRPARWGVAAWLGALAVASAPLLGIAMATDLLGGLADEVAGVAFATLPLFAAVLIVGWSWRYTGTERTAWLLIGVGVGLWWVGEVLWQYYLWVLDIDPYPSVADYFFVLGYPAVGLGMVLLPHVRAVGYDRLRLVVDTAAGSVAMFGLAWVLYLSDYLVFDGWSVVAILDAFYPLADLILASALLVLSMRRSRYTFDLRMVALALGVIPTTIADIRLLGEAEAGTFVDGGVTDALWLLGYAGFALAGFLGLRPPRLRDAAGRVMSVWQLWVPYALVGALAVVTLRQLAGEGGSDPVLWWSVGTVAVLVFVRQAVAIRENRALVERQRDELVASISHELRTPLTAVTGFTRMLVNGDLPPDEHDEILRIVDAQAQHLNRVVVDLVAIARNKIGVGDIYPESLAVRDLIDEAISMVGEADWSPEVEVDDATHVGADRARAVQVIVNLLTNALRYGRGRVRVICREVGTVCEIEVHDDGDGVPRRYQDAVWERFERGANRLNATVPGSGVGLYVVRSLVEAQGGRVYYRPSTPLGGACFGIVLPASDASG